MTTSSPLLKLALVLPTTVLLAETALACPFLKQRSEDVSRSNTTILVRDGSTISYANYVNQRPFGFIGVHLAEPNQAESGFSLMGFFQPQRTSDQRGIEIRDVLVNGPAMQSGLRQGDVILGVKGQEVSSISEIQQIIRATPVGQPIAVTYQRGRRADTALISTGDGRYLLDLMLQQQAESQR